jgi:Uma2 family endonuclease
MDPAFPDEAADSRMTVEQYFALAEQGVLTEEDRVELLDGVVVAVMPPNPPHAGETYRAAHALRRAVGDRAQVREEKPLVLGRHSVPEPDVAVVARDPWDYTREHPKTALLVVEVADTSLPQDRLSKARIYAGADIPEYWIVNLRNDTIEVMRDPDPRRRVYRETTIVRRGTRMTVSALAGVAVLSDDLLAPS